MLFGAKRLRRKKIPGHIIHPPAETQRGVWTQTTAAQALLGPVINIAPWGSCNRHTHQVYLLLLLLNYLFQARSPLQVPPSNSDQIHNRTRDFRFPGAASAGSGRRALCFPQISWGNRSTRVRRNRKDVGRRRGRGRLRGSSGLR